MAASSVETTRKHRSISVIGLGYVGTVSAACFAKMGHRVVGVDSNSVKVDLISQSRSPIVEADLPELIAAAVADGSLCATTDIAAAVADTEISLVCVGTPSLRDGSLDVSAVVRVCEQIGEALKTKAGRHAVVIRSTILPGTMRGQVIPVLERVSGRRLGDDLAVCNNPEFLREGTAVHDFFFPPKTVIGGSESDTAQVAELYDGIDAPLIRTEREVAEMVKYVDNCWHGVKVVFGNEIGNICKALGVNSHTVMDIFVQDVKLNLSPYYLRPGFAFGGSCLPKDLRALTSKGRLLGLELPLLNSALASNRIQVERAVSRILSYGKQPVSFLGFSFKSGTDDLRESPQVEVIERLLGKGYDLKLYDRNVRVASLTGANRSYIMNSIPHIASLMADTMEEALQHGKIVVVGNAGEEFRRVPQMLRPDQRLIDLVGIPGAEAAGERYDGINW